MLPPDYHARQKRPAMSNVTSLFSGLNYWYILASFGWCIYDDIFSPTTESDVTFAL